MSNLFACMRLVQCSVVPMDLLWKIYVDSGMQQL